MRGWIEEEGERELDEHIGLSLRMSVVGNILNEVDMQFS